MFKDIIGNDRNKELFKKIVNSNKVAHSYIFVGQEGIGKFLFAKRFAKAILCESESNKLCNKCKSCIKFTNNNHPDLYIINEENSIKNEQIRNMTKRILEKPIESSRKVYIINNSENMTKEAQNSLLKTLEEPPEYAIIILITKNQNLLLTTIKSRCTKIMFNKLKNDEIKKITTNYKVTEEILEIANGSAKMVIDLQGKEEIYKIVKDVFINLQNIDLVDFLSNKETIFKEKDNVNIILDYINILLYKMVYNNPENNKYIKCIEIIEKTKDRLEKNSNYDMTIDNLLFTIWEEVNG